MSAQASLLLHSVRLVARPLSAALLCVLPSLSCWGAGAQGQQGSNPVAQQLRLLSVGGSAEVLESVWTLAQPAQSVAQALRTGTGRAVLGLPEGGQLTLGSGSLLRINNAQPDVQSGRFFASGSGQMYMSSAHLYVDGQARFDAGGQVLRAAVISGSLRISLGGRSVSLRAGQQYDFRSGAVQPFSESDPWYLSRFVGAGEVSIQGTRGNVMQGQTPEGQGSQGQAPQRWQPAVVGQTLGGGTLVKTGENAWAELGFSGGGYLRLQAQSELKIVGIDKTSSGREVLLQLISGSAWNVVQKGQGGYQLQTPAVTTAVRGTLFRVDASGLVKVFEGQVALPSQADTLVGLGQQREAGGQLGALKVDALDTFNMALDQQRAAKTLLNLSALGGSELQLRVGSNPDAAVTASVGAQSYSLSGEGGVYSLKQSLPEGRYTLTVRVDRAGQSQQLTQALVIDRTPPQLHLSSVERSGVIVTLSGTVSDNFSAEPLLRASVAGKTYTLHASGAFRWMLPAPPGPLDLQVSVVDEAGNEGHAPLP
ncbi:FecR domain-containing protein [Deinococcus sp.]|uniref:FecR domain-containing protein n=1 Tax=Deinococcus sp. TaxID=47478 RepID=UPI003CC6B31C